MKERLMTNEIPMQQASDVTYTIAQQQNPVDNKRKERRLSDQH